MRRIKKVDEFVELFFSMRPCHRNVIYVTPPYEGFKRRLGQYVLFKITHEKVNVGRCHFCAHFCAMKLQVMVVFEFTVIHGKDHSY